MGVGENTLVVIDGRKKRWGLSEIAVSNQTTHGTCGEISSENREGSRPQLLNCYMSCVLGAEGLATQRF